MTSGGSSYDQALKESQGKFPGDAKNGQQGKRGIQTMPDGRSTPNFIILDLGIFIGHIDVSLITN